MLERMIRRVRGGDAEGGFTLIELLVVIVILGVLAAVVVVSVSFITDRGQNSACKTDVETIRSAMEEYYASQPADNPDYPHTGDPFATLYQQGYITTAAATDKDSGTNDTWVWTHNGYAIKYVYKPATTGASPTPATETVSGTMTQGGGAC